MVCLSLFAICIMHVNFLFTVIVEVILMSRSCDSHIAIIFWEKCILHLLCQSVFTRKAMVRICMRFKKVCVLCYINFHMTFKGLFKFFTIEGRLWFLFSTLVSIIYLICNFSDCGHFCFAHLGSEQRRASPQLRSSNSCFQVLSGRGLSWRQACGSGALCSMVLGP